MLMAAASSASVDAWNGNEKSRCPGSGVMESIFQAHLQEHPLGKSRLAHWGFDTLKN